MTLKVDGEILGLARSILKKYRICANCLGRQFPYFHPKLSSRERGEELLSLIAPKAQKHGECYLCRGLMSSTEDRAKSIADALSTYEFSTFLVGSKVPAESVEREDSVRAEFKLRGGRNMKAEFTRELVRRVASITGKRVSYRNPEIVAVFNPTEDSVRVIPKSLYVFGRYVKNVRGLPQKKAYGISPSIEEILARKILGHFGGRKVRFSWIGGEDNDSLVLGQGRPFYAELIEPAKRNLESFPGLGSPEDGVVITEMRVVQEKPPARVRFKIKVLADVKFDSPVVEDAMRGVESAFKDAIVRVLSTKRGKLAEKNIHTVKTEKLEGDTAKVTIECDGGLNIKKFVSGADQEVTPSISGVLGVGARCERFDVMSVDLLDHQL